MIRTILKTIPGVRPTVLCARRVYKDHFGRPDLPNVLERVPKRRNREGIPKRRES